MSTFDEYVARPLEANLRKLSGRDLANRNPMIYTARGTSSVEDWVDRVFEDRIPRRVPAAPPARGAS